MLMESKKTSTHFLWIQQKKVIVISVGILIGIAVIYVLAVLAETVFVLSLVSAVV